MDKLRGVLLYSAIILDYWLQFFHVGPLPPRNYVSMLIMAELFILTIGGVSVLRNIGSQVRSSLVILGFYLVWIVTACFFNGSNVRDVFVQPFSNYGLPILSIVYMAMYVTTERRLRRVVFLITFCATVSALIGILQFYNIEWAWKIRLFLLDHDPYYQGNVVGDFIRERRRICGLALYSVNLSYQLVALPPLLCGLIVTKSYISRRVKIFLAAALIIINVALILSFARSATIGASVGMVFILFTATTYKTKWLIIVVGIFYVLFNITLKENNVEPKKTDEQFAIDQVKSRMSNYSDESARSRKPALLIGMTVGLKHPLFGIKMEKYPSEAVSAAKHYPYVKDIFLGTEVAPHNSLLNVMIFYGIPALFIVFLFVKKTFKDVTHTERKASSGLLKSVCVGFKGAAIAYVFQIQFHNASIFYKEYYNWYIIGLAWVAVNIDAGFRKAERKRKKQRDENGFGTSVYI